MSSPLHNFSSLLFVDQSSHEEIDTPADDSDSLSALCNTYLNLPDDPLESTSTLGQTDAFTWRATGDLCHQPSESSETIMPGASYDSGTFDNASSNTLDDLFPCHELDENRDAQKIPFMVVPILLQGRANDLPPSPAPSHGETTESCQVDEDAIAQGDTVPRYSASQKGKGKVSFDEDSFLGSRVVRTPSPELPSCSTTTSGHPSVEEWVIGNRPILQDYADRQISLPVGQRLEVSIDEPSQSILAALKLLVNRDQEGCTEPSRRLGPQLIENFADIDHWAREYLRSRYHASVVDSEITTLLTIVINNFHEAQVQLIDRLVTRALENMRTGGRSTLSLEDFAFGFDFQMKQDLPFCLDTQSRFREPQPIPVVNAESTSGPAMTHSGRQVKPMKRAQEASETNLGGRRGKGKNSPQAEDRQATKSSITTTRQKEGVAKPSADRKVTETSVQSGDAIKSTPLATATIHVKYRPRLSSNLSQPPILSCPLPTTASVLDDNSESAPGGSTSADDPSVSCSSGSNTTLGPLPGSTIGLPAVNAPASSAGPTTYPEPTLLKSDNPPTNRPRGRRGSRARPQGSHNGGRGRGNATMTVTPSTEAPEAASDSAHTPPTAHPVGVGGVPTSATFDLTAVLRDSFPSLTSAAGSSAQPHTESGNDTNARNDDASTTKSRRTDQSLTPGVGPGHPQGKKRKLDACDG